MVADRGGPGLTADGEAFDQGALAAAHRTLQLPALARVTNLETGRSVLVRINDRGPDKPGRLIALTRAPLALLGASPAAPFRVRVQLMEAESRQLAAGLAGGGAVAGGHRPARRGARPRRWRRRPGAAASGRGAGARAVAQRRGRAAGGSGRPAVPLRLPEQVWQGPRRSGRALCRVRQLRRPRIRLDHAGRVDRLGAAHLHRLQCPARCRLPGAARAVPMLAAADAALDRALAARRI